MIRRKPTVVGVIAGTFYGKETTRGALAYFRPPGRWEIRYDPDLTESDVLRVIRRWHAEGLILQVCAIRSA